MISGVFAHAYSQAITIVIQVVSVPLFLTYWSPAMYGRWLILSAVPTYLTISDFGILTASANLVTMKVAAGDAGSANRVFNTTLALQMAVLPALALACAAALWAFPFGMTVDERVAVGALAIAALLGVFSGQFDSAYRAFGMYPRVTFYLSTARVAEWLGSLIGLHFYRSLAGVAIGYLAGRVLATLVMIIATKVEVPAIAWRLKLADRSLVKPLLKSGSGFLAMTLGSLLSIQGLLVVVGAAAGAAAAAGFNSIRTMTRALSQFSNLSSRSMTPEVSALHGVERHEEAEALVRRIRRSVVPLTLLGAVLIEWLGPGILDIWSKGKIPFDRTMAVFLLGSSVLYAIWQIDAVRLTATNRHGLLSGIYLVSACASVLIAAATVRAYGVSMAATAGLLGDVVMLFGTHHAIKKVLDSRARPAGLPG